MARPDVPGLQELGGKPTSEPGPTAAKKKKSKKPRARETQEAAKSHKDREDRDTDGSGSDATPQAEGVPVGVGHEPLPPDAASSGRCAGHRFAAALRLPVRPGPMERGGGGRKGSERLCGMTPPPGAPFNNSAPLGAHPPL